MWKRKIQIWGAMGECQWDPELCPECSMKMRSTTSCLIAGVDSVVRAKPTTLVTSALSLPKLRAFTLCSVFLLEVIAVSSQSL